MTKRPYVQRWRLIIVEIKFRKIFLHILLEIYRVECNDIFYLTKKLKFNYTVPKTLSYLADH